MAHADNTINIFANYEELKEHSGKTYANAYERFNTSHYRNTRCTTQGFRGSNEPHGFTRTIQDAYNEAWNMRNDNLARYIKRYNEKHEAVPIEELRHTSLWLDDNHRRLNGYHGVDNDTKYCQLHLKNEKPYLYQGIELEITWDDEVVDGYNGERFDEYGDYDDYGDYDNEGNYIPDTYNFNINEVVCEALKKAQGLFTAEQDGSLQHGYSAEFVSRPLSTQAWHSPQIKAILKDFTDYLKSTGAMVNQPEGNGFHIHVSRKFFEANPACNRNHEEVARDMNWIFQKFQNEIEAIGGREYNTWCASAVMDIKSSIANRYGMVIDKAHLEKKNLNVPYADHHRCFITSDSGYTYEARVFHSTLDPQQILACIEFMRNISHGARENALEGKTFNQIARYKDSPNLLAVIRNARAEKKLYLGKKNTNTLTVVA